MTVGERISKKRKELGISADELGKLLGVSRSTIFRYENGDIEKIPIDTLLLISKVLNTTLVYIMGWENDDNKLEKIGPNHFHEIPICRHINSDYPNKQSECIEGYGMFDVDKPENFIAFQSNDDSMINARIRENDLVLVHKQNYATSGQIVVCIIGKNDAILRRYFEKGDVVILQPNNPNYDPIVVNKSEFEDGTVKIIGVVRRMIIYF